MWKTQYNLWVPCAVCRHLTYVQLLTLQLYSTSQQHMWHEKTGSRRPNPSVYNMSCSSSVPPELWYSGDLCWRTEITTCCIYGNPYWRKEVRVDYVSGNPCSRTQAIVGWIYGNPAAENKFLWICVKPCWSTGVIAGLSPEGAVSCTLNCWQEQLG